MSCCCVALRRERCGRKCEERLWNDYGYWGSVCFFEEMRRRWWIMEWDEGSVASRERFRLSC